MSGKQIALIAGLAAGAFVMFQVRSWIRRWLLRAPVAVRYAVLGVVIGAVVFARRGLIPEEVALLLIVGAGVGGLVWARLRYSRSPSLQRWERAWDEIAAVSKVDPAAADRILLETEEADRTELELLRAQAATDPMAARRFRAGVRRELRHLEQSASRVRQVLQSSSGETPLASSLRRQRERREEDLRWVERILASGGAT